MVETDDKSVQHYIDLNLEGMTREEILATLMNKFLNPAAVLNFMKILGSHGILCQSSRIFVSIRDIISKCDLTKYSNIVMYFEPLKNDSYHMNYCFDKKYPINASAFDSNVLIEY